jgi:hypothetical protein
MVVTVNVAAMAVRVGAAALLFAVHVHCVGGTGALEQAEAQHISSMWDAEADAAAPLASLSTLPPIHARFCVITVHTGPLVQTFPLLVESCRRNAPDVACLVVHLGALQNQTQMVQTISAENMHYVQTLPSDMESLIQRTLGIDVTVALNNGYKWNDFKVAYGLIFKEWLDPGCEFWGQYHAKCVSSLIQAPSLRLHGQRHRARKHI